MRILAIRGENLASLAAPFALEFEQEPLRSAGLFAITGETGAGKSTILDALCLALYDDFPRVERKTGDDVPDASGEPIREHDPRTILRRGAGRGHAEADFVARDGRRYRARCDVMRARGKAAGRLQNRSRSLWRIDESGEIIEAVESGVEAVNRRILELTDLTFDQFRRTALLAQGDFDAFLRAEAKERADLLEKITGAEIYSRLSIKAFEKAREAREAVARLDASRREIGAMSDDERAALLAGEEALAAQRAALDATQRDVVETLRKIDAQEQAAAKLAQAETNHAAAARAVDDLAQERERLAALDRVAPLRGPREEAEKAQEQLVQKDNAAARAAEDAETARSASEAAQAQARAATDALDVVTKEIEALTPVWEKAAALDVRIETQREEVAQARDAEEKAAAAAADLGAALAKAREDEQTAREACDMARQAREALEPARALGEHWSEIDRQLTRRAQACREAREAGEALRVAEEALTQADQARAVFDRADGEDRAALARAATQRGDREKARDALDLPAARRAHAEALRARDALQTLLRLARDHDIAQEKAAKASADATRFEQEALSLARTLSQLDESRETLATARAEAERLGELAEAVADPHALALRAMLETGEACPVCGATDHPFAKAQDAANALVVALRAKRDAARRAVLKTEDEIAKTTTAEAKARALFEDATQRRDAARTATAAAARDYAAHCAQASPDGAPAQAANAGERLQTLLAQAETQRAAQEKIIVAGEALAADIELLGKVIDDRRMAMDLRRIMREEEDNRARVAGEDRARLTEAVAGARRRLEALDESLAPVLAPCDLSTADLDRDSVGARRRLEQRGAAYREAEAALVTAQQRLAEAGRLLAPLDGDARAAAGKAADAVAEHGARRDALAQLETWRGALLGGEATASHRARHEEKRRAARQALDAARDAAAQTDGETAACEARRTAAAHEAEDARLACATRREAYRAALAAAGLADEEAAPLLAVAPEAADALRAQIDAAKATLASAARAVAERRADLDEASAECIPQTPRAELEARRDAGAAQIETLLTQLGALRQRREQDDAARARATALSREIAEAAAVSRTWEEINAAIGSQKGDRFRRFAQGVTLEHLVALANRRLALLAPRYRLERAGEMGALGLQIVDRDLGDERRSTRSLSGGERFLASLALALALAGLEGRDSFVDTLFIDEGFGALDAATLDVAIDALETLQAQGRKVGVISHVESMQNRIATKVCVERRGGGVSVVRLRAAGAEAPA